MAVEVCVSGKTYVARGDQIANKDSKIPVTQGTKEKILVQAEKAREDKLTAIIEKLDQLQIKKAELTKELKTEVQKNDFHHIKQTPRAEQNHAAQWDPKQSFEEFQQGGREWADKAERAVDKLMDTLKELAERNLNLREVAQNKGQKIDEQRPEIRNGLRELVEDYRRQNARLEKTITSVSTAAGSAKIQEPGQRSIAPVTKQTAQKPRFSQGRGNPTQKKAAAGQSKSTKPAKATRPEQRSSQQRGSDRQGQAK